MDNADYNFESEMKRNVAFDFFLDINADLPTVDQFKNWPLSENQFSIRYTHYVKKPKPFAPKQTEQQEKFIDYYISPRKFIRYNMNQGFGFTYADNF